MGDFRIAGLAKIFTMKISVSIFAKKMIAPVVATSIAHRSILCYTRRMPRYRSHINFGRWWRLAIPSPSMKFANRLAHKLRRRSRRAYFRCSELPAASTLVSAKACCHDYIPSPLKISLNLFIFLALTAVVVAGRC